ncbi:unnamed protein product [Paramecium sonneborni]|uniref:U3 small nucleolar RNA-associated protein 13 C-terminal domain-containing protein n=1 Tax=Paramecium sonneborni TaxID=65129 RepID=A0A8S1K902_9CILI|nr:unnamed protein product [Paramecium sonneborni]
MVKIIQATKLLKSRRLQRLKLSKLSLQSKQISGDNKQQETKQVQIINEDQFITHIEPIKQLLPFYQGGKISIINNVIYTCFNFCVQYLEKKIQHNQEEIANFCVSNLNDYIATFTKNYMLRYVRLNDHITQFTIKTDPLFAIDMQFSPEDVYLALGGTNCMVKIINVKKNQQSTEFRVSGSVLKLQWIPIMRKLQIAIATDDRRISLFDLVANRILCAFVDFNSRITHIQFNQHILISSCNKYIKFWDTSIQKLTETIEFDIEIETFIYLKNTLIIGTESGDLHIKQQNKKIVIDSQFNGQQILKFMTCNEKLYIVTSELHIYITELVSGQIQQQKLLLGYNDEILHAKFIKNNQLLLATNSPFMKILNLDNMDVIAWKAHYSVIMCCEFIDDLIVTASKDNCVIIFKYKGFKQPIQLHKYSGHSDDVICIDVNSKYIASVSKDKTLKLWDLKNYQSEQSIKTVVAHEKEMNCVRFSPNNKLIATSSQDRLIKLWDDNLMNKMILKGHKRGVWDIQFSPIEKILASASGDNTIKLWNLSDGSIIKSFQGIAPQLKVSWLARGSELISTDSIGNIKLWNVKKQLCINTFSQHTGKIYALDIKRDNQDVYIITGANDSNLILWKDKTEQVTQQQQLQQHEIKIKLQTFQDLIRDKLFLDAAFLAFQNNYIKHFIQAVTQIYKQEDYENVVSLLSQKMAKEDLLKFLQLLITLNQSKKTYQAAQHLFFYSIKLINVNEFKDEKRELVKKLLQQLKYLTSKCFDRLESNYSSQFLIKFMIDKSKIVV